LKVIAIIPARFESTRLPGKVLADIAGKSIIQRVYEQAVKANVFDEVIIATDHQEVFDHCNKLNLQVELTSVAHLSGTDRIAEIAISKEADIFINIQGDEPFIEVDNIISLVSLLKNKHVNIGTLCKVIQDKSSLFDYNIVKLVKDITNKVLYFSRQSIPSNRDKPYKEWMTNTTYYQHLGLYGFKKETLLKIVKLRPSELELSEKLEQLRWLENGYTIYCEVVKSESFGIDTPEDLEGARKKYDYK